MAGINSLWLTDSHVYVLKVIYQFYLLILCIFGCAGSLLLYRLFSSCVAWASHCGGFSCFRAQALGRVDSVAVVPGL